jgi:predicted HTH domain antitoxin
MGFNYNIEQDYLFQQGRKKEKEDLIVKMIKDKTLSVEKIAELMEVPVAYVQGMAKELRK